MPSSAGQLNVGIGGGLPAVMLDCVIDGCMVAEPLPLTATPDVEIVPLDQQIPKAGWQPGWQYILPVPQNPYWEQQLPKPDPVQVKPPSPPQSPLGETLLVAVELVPGPVEDG